MHLIMTAIDSPLCGESRDSDSPQELNKTNIYCGFFIVSYSVPFGQNAELDPSCEILD